MAATSNQVQKLRAENQRLKEANQALRQQLAAKKPTPTGHHPFKKALLIFCVSLATALLFAANVLLWAGNTVTKTDRYVAATAPLIQDPTIQTALATRITERLYDNVDVEQVLTDALPPRADMLVPTLAAQVETHTETTVLKILQRPQFQERWNSAQQRAHARFIELVSTHGSDGSIDISEVYIDVSAQLKDTRLAFLAEKPLPEKVGSIQLVSGSWLTALQRLIQNIDAWRFISLILVFIFSGLAVWLSRNRRRTVLALGWLFAGVMLVTLLSLRLGGEMIANQVDPRYADAVRQAFSIITDGLVMQSRTVLAAALVIVFAAWVSGQSASSQAFRVKFDQLLAGKLHNAFFGKGENGLTRWVGARKNSLQWATVGLVAVSGLFIRVTPSVLFGQVLIILAVVLLVEILAAKPKA